MEQTNNRNNLRLSSKTVDLEKIREQGKQLILIALIKAFARTGTDPFTPEVTEMLLDDIREMAISMKNVSAEKIAEGIRKGSMGEMGATFKLTPQVIYIWVRTEASRGRIESLIPFEER